MGLHVVTGPATAGKSGVLYAELERASREGPSVLALPTGPDVHRASTEFATRGLLGIKVIQLDQWVDSLWRLHGDGRRIVTAALRQLIVGRVLDTLVTQGQVTGLRDSRGLRRLLSELVRSAPVSGLVVPQEGTEAQIAAACRAYWQELEELGHIEASEAAFLLGSDPPKGTGPVVLNRFTDLTAGQERFVTGLAGVTDVTVALTYEEGLPATAALGPLVSRLLSTDGVTHTVVPAGRWSDPALEALADGLFRGVRLEPPRQSLELLEASGADAECADVARRVRELIDGGFEPGRIAIVARDMPSRAESLWAALRAQEVPSEIDVAFAFGATAFGRALLGLLEAVGDPLASRERLLAFVLSPYSGVDPEVAADADAVWRQKRLKGAALLAASQRLRGMAEIVSLVERIASQRGPSEQWVLRWQRLAGVILANAESRRGVGGIGSTLDAAAHRSLLGTVGDIAEGAIVPTLAEVVVTLGRATVSTGAADEGAVQVTEAHRLRGRRFDAVVVMGLTAKEFSPEKPPTLIGILLRSLGDDARLDERLAERMLFYTLVTRARKKLVLSREASDERGDAIRPSAFWDEVLDLYCDRTRCDADQTLAISRRTGTDLAAIAPAFTPGRTRMRKRCDAAVVAPTRGTMSDPGILEDSLADHEYSASEIESYLACPYRWFVQRALRPTEMDVTFGARERGTYAHGLLKAFYDEWHARGHARVEPELLDEAMELFSGDEESRGARERVSGTAEEVAAAKAARWARTIVADDAGFLPAFAPVGHEVPFGTAHGVPLELGGVRLAGRIDRVERGPAGVVAIDYKSSGTVKGVASFDTNGLIQPTVYAAAASQVYGVPAAAGLYRSMRTLAVRGFWLAGGLELNGRGAVSDALDPEAFSAEFDRATDAIARAVDGMRAGLIDPAPARPSVCEYCVVRGVCGVS